MSPSELSIGAFKFASTEEYSSFMKAIETIINPENPWKHKDIESIGQRLVKLDGQLNPIAWWYFSRVVCSWGRGMRVWTNFNNHCNGTKDKPNESIANILRETFLTALKHNSAHDAMNFLLEQRKKYLKGFHVSFLSKHLRMLQPEKFGVLDSVLSEATGFALNPNGYLIFIDSLKNELVMARKICGKELHIADLEAAIFVMARGNEKEKKVTYNHTQYLEDARLAVGLSSAKG